MSNSILDPSELGDLATQLKVLADPRRLQIMQLLMQGVQCNCEIGDALQMPKNLVSHHLRVLQEAGYVQTERDATDARWIYYSLNPQALAEIRRAFTQFFDPSHILPRHPACGPRGARTTPGKPKMVGQST